MMKKRTVLMAVLAGSMLASSVVWAAEEENVAAFDMDQIVVTATRTPVEAFKAKANMSVITKEQLEDKNYPDLYTALRDVPGVQTNSYGQAGYFTSNGLFINGSKKVVVLIDGIRANQGSEIFSTGTITNMNNIERIEVLKGSASALYGADAQGGVVNIITKKAGTGNSKAYFHTGNYGKQGYGADINAKVDRLGIHVGANKAKEGNFKSAKSEKIYSDGQTNNFTVGLNYELKENSNIAFNYDNFNNHFSYLSPGLSYGGEGKYDSVNARLVWNQEFDEDTHNVLSIGHNRKAYVPTWGPSTFRSLLVQEQFSKKAGANLITAGIDHESTKVIDQPSYNAKYIGAEIKTTAFFLQDQISITDKLDLTAGIRFTDPNAYDSVWTPSINLGYDFNDNTNMYVAWSKFFNTPSISQLYDGRYGNANLKAENGKNFEVGVNHKFADDFTASAHYFYRTTTDALAFDYGTEKYYNKSDKVRAKGFDVQMRKAFGEHFAANVGYTYVNMPKTGPGVTEAANNYGFVPRSAWNIGGDYTNKDLKVGMIGRGIIKRPGQAVSGPIKSFPCDSYWVWDMNVSYKVKKNLKLYANVYNVFDQYYAENTDTYWKGMGWGSLGDDFYWWPMPGRSFIVGVEYSF